MLTKGAINHIFKGTQIPLNVQIQTSEKLQFLPEEQLVLHKCQIFDGVDKEYIQIKSQYTFYLNQQQPYIEITKFGQHNGQKCIEKYCTLQEQQLIPFNIQQYLEIDQNRQYNPSRVQQFSNIPDQRINIKGRLINKFNKLKAVNGVLYQITTIMDCLGDAIMKVASFQNDQSLMTIEENQECVFLNILVNRYIDERGRDEIRYNIDKDTSFFPINNIWANYDQINFQNIGLTFNLFGYISKIKNIKETRYQEITIVNFKKQKVKVIIQLPFAQNFKLQRETIVGFKKVTVIQKPNYRLALSFNDESRLCQKFQFEPPIDNQDDFQHSQYTEQIKLTQTNYEQILKDNQNIQYYRIIAKVKNLESLDEQTLKIKLDNNLIVIVKKKKYFSHLSAFFQNNFNVDSNGQKSALCDFLIKAIRQGQEVTYLMVKLYSRAKFGCVDEIVKKVKKE